MSANIKPGGRVTWQTGPGYGMPGGGTCTGRVRDVHPTAGIFVETDAPVPCVLGRGTELEFHTSLDGVWIPMNSAFQYTPPPPWVPPAQRTP